MKSALTIKGTSTAAVFFMSATQNQDARKHLCVLFIPFFCFFSLTSRIILSLYIYVKMDISIIDVALYSQLSFDLVDFLDSEVQIVYAVGGGNLCANPCSSFGNHGI